MKKFALGLSSLIAGMITGVILMGLLSMKASKIYLESIRIDYLTEQELLAVRAQKDGDSNQALIHYSNLVYATSPSGIRFFETMQSKWSFSFPFAAIIVEEIGRDAGASKLSRAGIEGVNRGKLGIILEALGRKNEAEEQYQIAAKLMGTNDTQEVRERIKYIQEKNIQNLPRPEK